MHISPSNASIGARLPPAPPSRWQRVRQGVRAFGQRIASSVRAGLSGLRARFRSPARAPAPRYQQIPVHSTAQAGQYARFPAGGSQGSGHYQSLMLVSPGYGLQGYGAIPTGPVSSGARTSGGSIPAGGSQGSGHYQSLMLVSPGYGLQGYGAIPTGPASSGARTSGGSIPGYGVLPRESSSRSSQSNGQVPAHYDTVPAQKSGYDTVPAQKSGYDTVPTRTSGYDTVPS